ncbi:MAG: hypothetical protein RL320_1396 [Pseudomonadota bacterium]
MTRTYRSSKDRRQEILSAAYDLLLQGGLGALTMPHLAVASGLSVGGLYRHFPSREDVLHALIVHDAEQLVTELQGFVDGKSNLVDRITKWCMTQINREVREKTLKLRLEILAMACRHELLAKSLAQYENEVCMQLRSMLMQAPPGSQARSQPRQSQELLCALIDGFATRGAVFSDALSSSRSLIKRTVQSLLDVHDAKSKHG